MDVVRRNIEAVNGRVEVTSELGKGTCARLTFPADPTGRTRRRASGAHVVVRLGKKAIDQETLLDAAHLAAHFSDVRGAPQVDVAWTLVKHVHQAKGAAPGAVVYVQDLSTGQRRIVAKVDQLLLLCDSLEAKLTKARHKSEKIANASVKGILTQNYS